VVKHGQEYQKILAAGARHPSVEGGREEKPVLSNAGADLASSGMAFTSLPLFPLNTVLFPDGLLPLRIFEVRYLGMIKQCIGDGTPFGVVLLTNGSEVRTPEGSESLAQVGTLARVEQSNAPMPGLLEIRCRGSERFTILVSERQRNGLWLADVAPLERDRAVAVPPELDNVADALHQFLESLQDVPEAPVAAPYRLSDCGWVANRWCELLPFSNPQKQVLLALDNPLIRLELVQDMLNDYGMLA
jgi:uncharacterized protein